MCVSVREGVFHNACNLVLAQLQWGFLFNSKKSGCSNIDFVQTLRFFSRPRSNVSKASMMTQVGPILDLLNKLKMLMGVTVAEWSSRMLVRETKQKPKRSRFFPQAWPIL